MSSGRPTCAATYKPGQEVALWKPRMDLVSTSADTYVAHEVKPWVPPPVPPPPPRVPLDARSSYREAFVQHPIEPIVIPPPPPRVVLPFLGASTTHTDFPPHPPALRRPSIGLAAGSHMHVVVPGALPLPASGVVELTTTQDGQSEMQLLVLAGDDVANAARNRLLAALPVGGLRPGLLRGDVRLQVRIHQEEDESLRVEAESAECVPRCRTWRILPSTDVAAAAVTECTC